MNPRRLLLLLAAGFAGAAAFAQSTPIAGAPNVTPPNPSFGELEFNNQQIEKTVGRVPKLAYNNPGLLVDVGVGLWASPLPMDFNHDGLMDLDRGLHGPAVERRLLFRKLRPDRSRRPTCRS
ncbi:MAG: hypothetical protein QM775_25200 [Pirellulales bacterium]